jgi:nucleotide-binding universal stress UspA family protein
MDYDNFPLKEGGLPMIPEIKRILYATDLSENSCAALSWVLSLANKFGAKVVLFHTNGEISQMTDVGIASQLGDQRWQELKEKNKRDAIDIIKKQLQHVCDEASGYIPSCPFLVEEIVVKRGYPVNKILCEAEDKNYDIVVMGTHPAGKLHNALMGSTARRVLRRSRIPVFIIPLSAEN